jgi:hypothetical protein
MNDIMIFNEIISNLGLLEIPLKGRKFTWSNMQSVPLLEQIDWVFTSVNWQCLPKYSSPSNGQANLRTHPLQNSNWSIPKAKIFRFEIFWIEHLVFFILSDLFGSLRLMLPRVPLVFC